MNIAIDRSIPLCSGRNGSLEADCVVLWLESPEEEIGSGRTEVDCEVLNAGEQEEESEDIEGLLSNRGSSDDLLSLEGFPVGISGSRSFGREGVSSLERLQLNCGTLERTRNVQAAHLHAEHEQSNFTCQEMFDDWQQFSTQGDCLPFPIYMACF